MNKNWMKTGGMCCHSVKKSNCNFFYNFFDLNKATFSN